MKNFKKQMSLFLTYLFIVSMVLSNFQFEVQAYELNKKEELLESIEGQLIVKIKDIELKDYEEIIQKYNGQIIDVFNDYLLISLNNEDIKLLREELNANSNVEYTELNALGTKSGTTIDPLSSSQGYLFKSSALDAWDYVTDTMKAQLIKVAVIDTGIKSDHEDLIGKIDTSLGYNFVDNNTNTSDDNGHGTNVAGVIAASHNGKGINGIAGLINTKIIPIKVLDSNGVGSSLNVAKGIRYAADKGANIINVSINGKGYSKVIDDAIKYASAKGILIIASAGNDRGYAESSWPCNSEEVLVVADNFTYDKGERVDVAVTSSGTSTGIANGSAYEEVMGSSISSAVVSGAAALIKAKNPALTVEEIKNIIKVSTDETEKYEINLNISKCLDLEKSFIEILTPVAGKDIDGNVEVKISALTPTQVKDIKIYLNGDSVIYKALNGNGGKEYTTNINYEDLLTGTNKLEVVATDLNGKSYTEQRYFSSANKSKVLTLVVNGLDNMPLKGATVSLSGSEVITDDNGEAKFLDIEPASIYQIKIVNGVDTEADKMYYTFDIVSTGRHIIDLAKESKVLDLKAYKADNKTPLSNANIMFNYSAFESSGLGYNYFKLDSNGALKLNTNKDKKLKTTVLSNEEGYIYSEEIDVATTSEKVFKVDSTVSKIDFNNIYDSKINLEKVVITTAGVALYNYPIDITNKSLYVTNDKNTCFYYYAEDETLKQGIMFEQSFFELNSSKIYSFTKPTLNLKEDYGSYYLTIDNNGYSGKLGKNTEVSYKIVDPNGKVLINNKDYKVNIKDGDFYGLDVIRYFNLEVKDPIAGVYKISASAKVFGEVISSNTIDLNLNSNNSQEQSNIPLKVTPPDEFLNKFTDKNEKISVYYEIYRESDKEVLKSKSVNIKIKDIGNVIDFIGKGLIVEGNRISINASFSDKYSNYSDKGGFIIDRPIGNIVNNELIINGNDGNVRKVKFTNNTGVNISNVKVSLTTGLFGDNKKLVINDKTSLNDINIWADINRTYNVKIEGKNLALVQRSEFKGSNPSITLTNNIAKLKINTPSNNYMKKIKLTVNNGDEDIKFDLANSNLKNNIIVNSDFKISNIDYIVRDISDLISGGARGEYSFDCNFSITKGQTKIIDMTNLKVEYAEGEKSVNYSSTFNISIRVYNSDLELKKYKNNIRSNQNNKDYPYYDDYEEEMFLYNEKGKLADKLNVFISYWDGLDSVSVKANGKPGRYTAKLELVGLNPKDNGFTLDIVPADSVTLRIMDPFDTSKPLADTDIHLGNEYSSYKTDKNGYVTIKNYDFSAENPITIVMVRDGKTVVFDLPKNVYTTNETISISVSTMKNVTLRPSVTNGKISISNKIVTLELLNSQVKIKLNSEGKANIYTNRNFSNIYVSTDNGYISTKYSGSGDIVFDNDNLGGVIIPKDFDVDNGWHEGLTFINSYGVEISANKKGTFYLTPGIYEYLYSNESGIKYKGIITIVKGVVKEIQTGTTFVSTITTTTPTIAIGDRIHVKMIIKDQYNNIIDTDSGHYIKIYDNGVEVENIYCYSSIQENGEYNLYFKPEYIYENFSIKVESGINYTDKIISNLINLKTDTTGYKKIAIKDPSGALVTSGEVIKSSRYSSDKVRINNGYVYLKSNSLDIADNYSVFGKNNTGQYVLYGNLKINADTTVLKVSNARKIPLKILVPEELNGKSSKFEINKKAADNEYYDINIVRDYFYKNSDENLTDMYGNKEIYIDENEYSFKVKISNINDYYLFKNVDKSVNSITLDANKMTQVKATAVDGGSSRNITLYNGETYLDVNNGDYVQQNIFNKYKLYDNENKLYYTKTFDTNITSPKLDIQYGNIASLEAKTDDNLVIEDGGNVNAKVYFKDRFGNIVYNYNGYYGKVIFTFDGVEKKEYFEYFSSYAEGYYKVRKKVDGVFKKLDVSYTLDIGFGEYESNIISYTMDLSKYKTIPVYDPKGNKLVKGSIGSNIKILDGLAYIAEGTKLSSYYKVVGVNELGERVIYESYYIDDKTTEIKDTSLALYTINIDQTNFSNIESGQLKLIAESGYFSEIDFINSSDLEIKPSYKYYLNKAKTYHVIMEMSNKDSKFINSGTIATSNNNVTISNNANVELIVQANNIEVQNINFKDYGSNLSIDKNNKKIYFEPNKGIIESINVKEGYSIYRITISNSKIGSNKKIIPIGNERNYSVALDYIQRGSYLSIDETITDEYGNVLNKYVNTDIILKKSNGDIVSEIKYTVPSDIPKGTYLAEVIFNKDTDDEHRVTVENVRVVDYSDLIYQLTYFNGFASYKLSDGGNVIDSKTNSYGRNYIINEGNIEVNKNYNFEYLKGNSYSTYDLRHFKGTFKRYDETSVGLDKEVSDVYYYLGQDISKLSIYTQDGLKLENIDINNKGVNLQLLRGYRYIIEALRTTSNGVELVKTEFVAGEVNEITFNSVGLKKISLVNGFNTTVNINNIKLTNSNGSQYNLGYLLSDTDSIYVPAGSYNLTFDALVNDLAVITYNKSLNLTSNNGTITIGKNVSYEVGLTSDEYSINEEVIGKISNIKDSEGITKTVFNNKLEDLTIDLMHGQTVITTFNNTLPDTLSGEAYIRVSGNSDIFGKVKSNNILININNSKAILKGDINLDSVVDIYDIVYISKDMGLEKGNPLFDPRVNLDNSNDVIDIVDLSQAAMNYSN